MVVEIRDWCQNVGEYNTYNFCIWHFGLCVIVSKIDRCRSSDPPYEIAINPIFRSYHVSDVIIQSFLNRSRWNLVHTLVARRARSAISDCLVSYVSMYHMLCTLNIATLRPPSTLLYILATRWLTKPLGLNVHIGIHWYVNAPSIKQEKNLTKQHLHDDERLHDEEWIVLLYSVYTWWIRGSSCLVEPYMGLEFQHHLMLWLY